MRTRLALVAVAVLSAGLLSAVPAALTAPAQAVSAPTPISTSPFTLSANYALNPTLVSALDAKLPNVTVSDVMDHANHTRGAFCHSSTVTQIAGPQDGFCFDSTDDGDCTNSPQGITTSRDAVNGDYDGHQIVVVSWNTHECTSSGTGGTAQRSRLTLVDWDATYPNMYRKVLLVIPTGSTSSPSFADIKIHAGGVAWYGDYLYVADTNNGLRVFDMRKIWQVNTGGSSSSIGCSGSTCYAHNYAYVLPQTGMITDTSSSQLTWSSVALDRAQPSLTMGEYVTSPGGRAVRFPLNSSTHQLVVSSDGKVHATQAVSMPFTNIQGTLSHNGRWWFASSGSKALYYWVPGSSVVTHTWTSYCEDLSYWEDPSKPDLIWSLRENSGGRVVFDTPQADLD